MNPLVRVTNLVAGYGSTMVLNRINLVIQPGERVALLGPNGSGKSTLLRCLTHSLRTSSGEIELMGSPLASLKPAEIAIRVASVPQEEAGRFSFLVRDVVTLGRMAQSGSFWDTPEDRDIADRAMKTADCYHLAERPFPSLSGGERQRVLIARALAQQTQLILLDEPTSHLDPAHQLSVADLIASLARQGVGIVAAVHDLNLVSRFATRAILMDSGEVALDGEVEAVLNDPALDRVFGVPFTRLQTPMGQTVLLPGPLR